MISPSTRAASQSPTVVAPSKFARTPPARAGSGSTHFAASAARSWSRPLTLAAPSIRGRLQKRGSPERVPVASITVSPAVAVSAVTSARSGARSTRRFRSETGHGSHGWRAVTSSSSICPVIRARSSASRIAPSNGDSSTASPRPSMWPVNVSSRAGSVIQRSARPVTSSSAPLASHVSRSRSISPSSGRPRNSPPIRSGMPPIWAEACTIRSDSVVSDACRSSRCNGAGSEGCCQSKPLISSWPCRASGRSPSKSPAACAAKRMRASGGWGMRPAPGSQTVARSRAVSLNISRATSTTYRNGRASVSRPAASSASEPLCSSIESN
ncbi:MAG: hypothetical protein BWZ08_02402 [candidate division BRC1 bacterium ADurb.BinA292]|nr:MAG: hypothetical protein BWZ08_02402 [candidate division BRC1 bacterium ADurb.BinA292]